MTLLKSAEQGDPMMNVMLTLWGNICLNPLTVAWTIPSALSFLQTHYLTIPLQK